MGLRMVELQVMSVVLGTAVGALFFPLLSLFRQQRVARAQRSVHDILRQAHEKAAQERADAKELLSDDLAAMREKIAQENEHLEREAQRIKERCQERERELKAREIELHAQQERVQKRESLVTDQLDKAHDAQRASKDMYARLVRKLEDVGQLSAGAAKRELVSLLEEEVNLERKQWLVKVEEETRLQAKERATQIVVSSMQRYLADMVTSHTSSSIPLPNDEMKGRIIGKEGRNIRSLEMATGMDFVLGENSDTITISGFNPLRREIARRVLERLMSDGRINPTRIEEAVEECEQEIDLAVEERGTAAILDLSIPNVHPEIITLLGKLHFRTSYSQNVLAHSIEVAHFARMIAGELGLDEQIAARCGLFHDIGKAVSAEVEGPHAQIGADLAREYGETPVVVNAIAAHHNEVPIKTVYDVVTQVADACSAARPGARRETLTTYVKRLEHLEKLTLQFEGVKKAYALQAGREVRVIVNDEEVDDGSATVLARDIVKKIESEMNFPGQIKVSVIREKRVVQYAK